MSEDEQKAVLSDYIADFLATHEPEYKENLLDSGFYAFYDVDGDNVLEAIYGRKASEIETAPVNAKLEWKPLSELL